MKLEALFAQPDALPVIPRVMQELIASFNDEAVDAGTIAQHISSDQVLSAKLLQLANSPYYQVSNTISTVPDAVAMLGFVNIRTLVISIGLKGSFKPVPGMDSKQFWRHSVHTAVASRYLARPLGLNPDLAFTVGLMHAIGQLVMHLAMPQAMLKIDQRVPILDPRRLMEEHQVFGYSHLDAGAELARRWKFPAVFSDAIAASVNPLAQSGFDPLAAEIHIAAWRSRAEENHLGRKEMDETWPAEVAARLALPSGLVLQDFPSWDVLSEGMQALMS
jgi:putative nucleotidyltransferase with HDIG domain